MKNNLFNIIKILLFSLIALDVVLAIFFLITMLSCFLGTAVLSTAHFVILIIAVSLNVAMAITIIALYFIAQKR